MSKTYNAIIVTLTKDLPQADVDALMGAFRLFDGVAEVSANEADLFAAVSKARARQELTTALWEVLYPKVKS